jgi:hypothetical protein
MSVNSNPFHSTLVSIFLQNFDASQSVDILKQNTECVFHRLEMESSIFDAYPSGVIIVQDRNDLLTRLSTYSIDYVVFKFENGDTINFRLHSASHTNNAASQNEATFLSIYFTNYIYHYAQQHTLTKILNTTKPKVFRIDKFIKHVSSILENLSPGVALPGGTIDETENYVCYRPLNPKLDGTEVSSDNVLEYLNYLSSLAVPLKTSSTPVARYADRPRFFMWTDWESKINFKCLTSVLGTDDPVSENRRNLYNFKYAIYAGDTPETKIGSTVYKKIYNYSTNQGLQFITKDYYYVRKTPKILDAGVSGGNTYYNLAYQFLDEGSRYNIEIVGSSVPKNGSTGGSEELVYNGNWGYVGDSSSNSKNSNESLIGNQYGYSNSYYNMSIDGMTGSFEYIDNSEMWKNVFDLTPLDPYYPTLTPSAENASNSNLQKVINIRHNALTKGLTAGSQIELIRKIELQNFILYSLCCMGSAADESFFAMLTSYHRNSDYDNDSTDRKWLYGWSKIKFTGSSVSPEPEDIFNMLGTGWTFDNSESSGSYSSASDLSRFAINLNEVGNVGGSTTTGSVLSPGWAATNSTSSSSFNYRPIGAKSNITNFVTGDIKHIVKMYKKSWQQIFAESGYTGPVDPADAGNILYYFTAENIVDGACT